VEDERRIAGAADADRSTRTPVVLRLRHRRSIRDAKHIAFTEPDRLRKRDAFRDRERDAVRSARGEHPRRSRAERTRNFDGETEGIALPVCGTDGETGLDCDGEALALAEPDSEDHAEAHRDRDSQAESHAVAESERDSEVDTEGFPDRDSEEEERPQRAALTYHSSAMIRIRAASSALATVFLLSAPLCAAAAERASKVTCDALYYGIDRTKDLPKAFACYGVVNAVPEQIVMLLNGEGVDADVRRAEQLFKKWKPREDEKAVVARIRRVLRTRAAPDAKAESLQLCEDFLVDSPITNPDLGFCAQRNREIEQAVRREEIDELRRALPTSTAAVLGRVEKAFAAFSDAEGTRVFAEVQDAHELRQTAPAGQLELLDSHFITRIKEVLGDKSLPASSAVGLRDADATLNTTYQEKLAEPGLNEGARETLKTAQRAWLKYRDAFSDLASTRTSSSDADREAIRTLLTLDRISELQAEF
jgi:hypothetical protein